MLKRDLKSFKLRCTDVFKILKEEVLSKENRKTGARQLFSNEAQEGPGLKKEAKRSQKQI